jgi:tripartite-type tricarboxylate transporter receptor subunit TctC
MLPDVPTFAEQGYPQVFFGFSAGLMAPAGTPIEIREKIADAAREALSDPDFRKKFVDGFGYEVISSSPQEFADFLVTAREEAKKKVELAGASKK